MKDEEEPNLDHIQTDHLGAGMSFTSGYRNFDEMMADMRRHEEAAIARMLPEQEAMIHDQDEQWFINLSVDPRELFICGEAWSLNRGQTEELESYGVKTVEELSDEDKRAFKSSCAMFADSRSRGYIFGKAYSSIEPRGELGSTHVSTMWPISEVAFEEARRQNWTPDLFSNSKSINIRTALLQLHLRYKMSA